MSAELDIVVAWQGIRKNLFKVFGIPFLAASLSFLATFLVNPQYSATVTMVVSNSLSSLSGNSMGAPSGLAAIGKFVGVNLPSDSANVETQLARLRSRNLLLAFAKEKDLRKLLFAENWDDKRASWKVPWWQGLLTRFLGIEFTVGPSDWDLYYKVDGFISIDRNFESETYTLIVTWKDPALATEWANGLVALLNSTVRDTMLRRIKLNLDYLKGQLAAETNQAIREAVIGLLQQQLQQDLIIRGAEDIALEVIDPAMVPEDPSQPKRLTIALLIGLLTLIPLGFRAGLAGFRQIED